MITFLMGLMIGTFVGMLIMVIFVAGKKEGALRDNVYYKI